MHGRFPLLPFLPSLSLCAPDLDHSYTEVDLGMRIQEAKWGRQIHVAAIWTYTVRRPHFEGVAAVNDYDDTAKLL